MSSTPFGLSSQRVGHPSIRPSQSTWVETGPSFKFSELSGAYSWHILVVELKNVFQSLDLARESDCDMGFAHNLRNSKHFLSQAFIGKPRFDEVLSIYNFRVLAVTPSMRQMS